MRLCPTLCIVHKGADSIRFRTVLEFVLEFALQFALEFVMMMIMMLMIMMPHLSNGEVMVVSFHKPNLHTPSAKRLCNCERLNPCQTVGGDQRSAWNWTQSPCLKRFGKTPICVPLRWTRNVLILMTPMRRDHNTWSNRMRNSRNHDLEASKALPIFCGDNSVSSAVSRTGLSTPWVSSKWLEPKWPRMIIDDDHG